MLFQRYASPMVILEKMVQTRRLSEFVREFVNIRNNELVEKTQWEYWLHRVFDMPFGEYLERSSVDTQAETVNTVNLAQTVSDSFDMVNSFCPA